MNKIITWFAVGGIALLVVCCGTGCASAASARDVPVVKNFDAARYMGTWHEIARLPKWFERDLDNVTATYAIEGGMLRITNRGFRNGREKVSTAVGRFAGPPDEGAFRVSFFRPFYGDYRIVWLSPDYDLALVTGGDKSSLWILSREKRLRPERRVELVELAARWGFDVAKLEYPR
ncbi:MAG: lipocalin family protein [Kiritimatiellae bacterium]|nr:lipocalin family protein [Kiritimatiellia bacterium]